MLLTVAALLTTTNYGVQLLQTLGALLIVCALAFVVLRFVSRRGLVQLGGERLRLEATLPLGTRQRIAIVRVDGEELLIGVSDQGISLLRELPERPEDEIADSKLAARPSFAARLLKKSA